MSEEKLYEAILSHRDESQVANLSRFFKTGKGEYGEGDQFLGIKVPVTRAIVKSVWGSTTFEELERCVTSPLHEIRLAALLTLIQIFKHAKKEPEKQKQCVDFYLSHTAHINNWDLVDLSCYEILGAWLFDKDRTLLYDLAQNGKTIWEQRIGIVSTMKFVRNGDIDDTFKIADILSHHPHDLIQKAVGWLLRECGKQKEDRLKNYLKDRYKTMPRTTLRYAIERFEEEERRAYLRGEV
ncbi:MAG: DNA alkylation repair protein [Paludibacteraceae bacterium]|nr:DNA alkylation repair protein [Paludibacteraceae bacterium]